MLNACAFGSTEDQEELRLVFTHIDGADPDKEFSFGIRSNPDNVWEGACPPTLRLCLFASSDKLSSISGLRGPAESKPSPSCAPQLTRQCGACSHQLQPAGGGP